MRSSDGGGPDPLSNGGNTWHIKLDGIYAGPTSGMTLQDVKALIEPIQPDRVVAAGASYQRATQKLTELASNLIGHAQKLAGAWGGSTAPKAIAQMQQLHNTAVDLANTSQGTSKVLGWYGTTIQPWYKSQIQNMSDTLGDKVTGFLTGTDPANTAAANQLAKLNARTVEAYNSIPPAANKNLPPLDGSYGAPGSGGGVSGGSGGGTSLAGSRGGSGGGASSRVPVSRGGGSAASGGGGGVVAGGAGGGPGGPVIGGGHGNLSGFNPTPGGAPGGPGGGPVVGGPGLGSPGGPSAPGAGPILPGPVIGAPSSAGPVGEPVPGEPVSGAPGMGGPGGDPVVGEPIIGSRAVGALGGENAAATEGQALAEGSAANGVGAAGDAAAGDGLAVGDAAGAEAMGGPGVMPMGAGGQGGEEREHSTWLTEDRDVWKDDDKVTPPVIR
jgi:uncharacterized protein YukE